MAAFPRRAWSLSFGERELKGSDVKAAYCRRPAHPSSNATIIDGANWRCEGQTCTASGGARQGRGLRRGGNGVRPLMVAAHLGVPVIDSDTMGRAYPELGDEFQLTAIELSFLTERRMAFENLATRVKLDAVKGVVTTMIQTEKYGTPLASALRVLSAEFRHERMMRAEEKAARLPAIMTVPLILFILPTLFVVILGPAACSISTAF